jgi:hypothetical protein
MRNCFWLIIIALAAALGAPNAHADSSAEYNLSFTGTGTLPVSGSFTYDTTTNQFTNFSAVWDGLPFDFTFDANNDDNPALNPTCVGPSCPAQTNYLELTGVIPTPLQWEAVCETFVSSLPCDELVLFTLDLNGSVLGGTGTGTGPTSDMAEGVGHFTVSAPEPDFLSLMLVGIGAILALRRRSPLPS